MSSEYKEPDDMVDDQEFLNGSIAMRKRGQKGVDGSIAEAIQEMAASSKLRMAAVNYCDSRYGIAKCIKELDAMKLVDGEVYLAALDLFNNPNARETFLSLKCDKRFIWLYRKCANLYTALSFKELL